LGKKQTIERKRTGSGGWRGLFSIAYVVAAAAGVFNQTPYILANNVISFQTSSLMALETICPIIPPIHHPTD